LRFSAWRRLAPILGALASAAATGCSPSDANLAPVEGVVRLDGQPLTSGKVLFQPTAGRGAMGLIQSDGTFTLGTYRDADGALIGEHKVAIVAYEGDGGRPDPTAGRKPLKPLVPEHYLAPGTSNLTFEVKSGDNRPEFDLKSIDQPSSAPAVRR
jgi:hypothetical protein